MTGAAKRLICAALLTIGAVAVGLVLHPRDEGAGSYDSPILISGKCPAALAEADGGSLRLSRCFHHKKLGRQVCEYNRFASERWNGKVDYYLYVACD
jgi:hypothetical protein